MIRFILIVFFSVTLKAENIETIESKILSIKSKILNDSAKSRKTMAGLYNLRQNMKKVSKERGEYEAEVFALKNSINTMGTVVEGLQNDTREKRKLIRGRVIALYKLGGRGMIGTLLGSRSSSEFDRNIRIINSVVSNDIQLLATYRDNIDLMQFKKDTIEKRLAEVDEKRQKVAKLEARLKRQNELNRRIVRSLKRTRSGLLNQLADYRDYMKNVDMSERERGVLRTLLNPTILEKKGQLIAPTRGEIYKKYGVHRLPGNQIQIRNKGWFYKTKPYQQVQAVFSGDVVYAQAFPKFTKTVIIDHGSSYFTVYSNLKDVTIKVGDVVREGQLIGHAGFNALYAEHGMQFEIRHFSDPQNPQKWISKNRNMKISALQMEKEDHP